MRDPWLTLFAGAALCLMVAGMAVMVWEVLP